MPMCSTTILTRVVGMAVGMEKMLSARKVATAGPGYYADGGGLYLQVTESGARSWILRYQLNGRRREMGLGSVSLFGLAEARERALAGRRLLADGIDPIDARRADRSRPDRLWGHAVDDFIRAHRSSWKSSAQEDQWRQSLRDYGPAADTPLSAIDTEHVMRLMRAIWSDKTETATRVRSRIERIWSAERVAGHVTGENPARWRGHLDALLPRPSRVAPTQHHRAMPYTDINGLWHRLIERDGAARRALRFTILTAARTGEVTGASWDEFDLDAGFWDRPGIRMKSGKAHTIPLTQAALDILRDLPRTRPPFALSENAMLFLVQKPPPKGFGLPYTVHGFRSTFRDWAGETTHHPREVIEHALAHQIRDKAEAAYARGTLIEKRRTLMKDWSEFVTAPRQSSA